MTISRHVLTSQITDQIARDLAEYIIKHRLTKFEVECITADLAGEATWYAAELEAEDTA